MRVKLTQEEAIRFHDWLRNPNISEHKWEIMQELDEIIGYCPTQTTKKKVMNGGDNRRGEKD